MSTESTAPLKPEALEAAMKAVWDNEGEDIEDIAKAAIRAYLAAASLAPQEQGGKMRAEVEAAQRIFEVMCGGPVDWAKHATDHNEDNLFQSADWATCLTYAKAALSIQAPASEPVADVRNAHFGDPCVFCNIPHDDVVPGACIGTPIPWICTCCTTEFKAWTDDVACPCCKAFSQYTYPLDYFPSAKRNLIASAPAPAPAVPALGKWEIDHSTTSPILTYEKCSVIQDEQAYFVMELVRAALAKEPAPAVPADLVERLNATYTAWNNPQSDGLPEGASILLEAASALVSLTAERDEAKQDIETFWKPQFDEQVVRAERAEAALASALEALNGIHKAVASGIRENGLPDHTITMPDGTVVKGPVANIFRDVLVAIRDVAAKAIATLQSQRPE